MTINLTKTHSRPRTEPSVPSAAIAFARGLVKTYGTGETAVQALAGVDVDFAGGELTAIMGPSGSGKSTLLHCLAGLDQADEGTVHIGQNELTALDDTRLTRLRRDRVGFVFQSFNLLPTLTAEENILLAPRLAGRKVDSAWFATIVDMLGLRDRLRHKPGELSGGQRQRVACARALVGKPDVVFADEPTGNLDSRTGADVLEFLRTSVRDLGQTVVMVTHDPIAASYASRVVLLADGRVAGEIHHPTPESVLGMLGRLGA